MSKDSPEKFKSKVVPDIKYVAAAGERASRGIWFDPSLASGFVHKDSPERIISTYHVAASKENEDGSVVVAYIDQGRTPRSREVGREEVEEFRNSLFSQVARGSDGAEIELTYVTNPGSPVDLVLEMTEKEDGSLLADVMSDPLVNVRTIGGPEDRGLYRLSGSTLTLVKPKERTSFFEFTSLAHPADSVSSSNFGTTISRPRSHSGRGRATGFLPVEGKKGKGGKKLQNEFAGDIPVPSRD